MLSSAATSKRFHIVDLLCKFWRFQVLANDVESYLTVHYT